MPTDVGVHEIPDWATHVEKKKKRRRLLDASGALLAARALRRPGEGSPDLFRVAARCPLPKTPDGRPARPNVLMFGDGEVDLARIDAQEGRFRRNAVEIDVPSSISGCRAPDGREQADF